MSILDHGPCRSGISRFAVLVVALVSVPTYAQPAESRDRLIDGSTTSSFEASIIGLQNELRSRRREDFERALAVIWMSQTVGSSDLDRDGDLDLDDFELLEREARELLTQIQRGNLLSAIEEREKSADGYTAAEYIEQLDGLGYDEVLDLAGRPSEATFLDRSRRQTARAWDPRVDLCKLFPSSSADPSSPESVPIVRVPPRYPGMALDDGLSGAVCLEFTLDSDGAPQEVVVVGSTASVFEEPALVAFTRWKYPPLVEPARLRMQMVFYLAGLRP